MPRKKISEFRSKQIVYDALEMRYVGWSIASIDDVKKVSGYESYVVKVDQAVKGRFKKGLVKLNVVQKDLVSCVARFLAESYNSILIEPYIAHNNLDERYFSITQDRSGVLCTYSNRGGIDVEENKETIKTVRIDEAIVYGDLSEKTGFSKVQLRKLFDIYSTNHFTFLEINPYIIHSKELIVLDIAIEVDDAGRFFTNLWNSNDMRYPRTIAVSEPEAKVLSLNDSSSASFNLSVLNPDGAIFLLLSGGGASVVIADEINSAGRGKDIANYGEYSGNPNVQETQYYAEQVLELLIQSRAPRKVLFIGGAVANFTDIAITFSGIIAALDVYSKKLKKESIKIYVRRGGPNQSIGLLNIKTSLEGYGLSGGVYGPDVSIVEAIDTMLKGLN